MSGTESPHDPPNLPLSLPDDWTPAQAAGAFELIDLLRDHLWSLYGADIQTHLRDERLAHDPPQLQIPLATDPPF